MTLAELLKDYLIQNTGIKSESSLYQLKTTIPNLMKPYLHKDFAQITRNDILNVRTIIASKQVKDGTHLRNWTNVLSLLRYANKKYGYPNVAADINSFRNRTRSKTLYWSKAEFNQYMSVVDDLRFYCMTGLMFLTGLRLGEILALNLKDIDLFKRQIRIDKTCSFGSGKGGYKIQYHTKTTKSTAFIKIPTQMMDPLLVLIKECKSKKYHFLFHNNCDEPLRGFKVRYQMRKYIQKAGVTNITPRGLRTSCGNYLLDEGVSVPSIAAQLRHSSILTTLRFYLNSKPHFDNKIESAQEMVHLEWHHENNVTPSLGHKTHWGIFAKLKHLVFKKKDGQQKAA